ncbi:unnamed protein product [Vitrella brassicaformis CCMP3155]|uniref:Uncharacterized protein n=1 Tax=Vitrella brassicaformis (strain CCMP3155) TaxID=1169540 RepID=A0A0G4FZB5_VITBC|nr:unnamed protein product [Vitrella brassicaformis CCMP3155]|eukprot:CEM20509.1 unnamed protein product [Vitrella brassicaformis CCMP3155]
MRLYGATAHSVSFFTQVLQIVSVGGVSEQPLLGLFAIRRENKVQQVDVYRGVVEVRERLSRISPAAADQAASILASVDDFGSVSSVRRAQRQLAAIRTGRGAVFDLLEQLNQELLKAQEIKQAHDSTVAQLNQTIRVKDSQLQRHSALLTVKDDSITQLKQEIAAHHTRIDRLEQQNATLEKERLTDDRLHQCGSAAEIKSIAARAGEEMVRLAGFKRRAEAQHDQREKEEDESDRMCVACQTRERTVALPCGCVCFCEECYRRVLSGPPERADDGGDEDEEFEEEPRPKCAFCRKPF